MADKTYKKIKRRLWYFVYYYKSDNSKLVEKCFNSAKRMRNYVNMLHDNFLVSFIGIKIHWCYREYTPRHIIRAYSPRKNKIIKCEKY